MLENIPDNLFVLSRKSFPSGMLSNMK